MAQASDYQPVVLINGAGATSAAARWPGGKGTFAVGGTFAGATVSLQAQMPDGTFIDIPSSPQTANGFFTFELGAMSVRAAVGSSSGTVVFAIAYPYQI